MIALTTIILACAAPMVTDGDTLRCNGERVRLARIDAPEMPGHCRRGRDCAPGDPYAARDHLRDLTRGIVECEAKRRDRYGRLVAECEARGLNLSDAMMRAGHARRYR